MPSAFSKRFSLDHKRAISRLETAILERGQYAQAIYRGFGKTTISEGSMIWTSMYGHRHFPVLFQANQDLADDSAQSIKVELETNELLLADFPEVCLPIQHLEREPRRCKRQTHEGQNTYIEWGSNKLVLATVNCPWAQANGVVLYFKGLLGASRGIKHKRPNGQVIRPDFANVDDPVKDEEAANPLIVAKKLKIIHKVILQLSGRQRKMACVVSGTIIEPDDVMDRLTDPEQYPDWSSERLQLIQAMPDATDTLWTEYKKIRDDYNRDSVEGRKSALKAAGRFYRKHRKEMHRGAKVSCNWAYDPDVDQSTLQAAMNLYLYDRSTFQSECQNSPQRTDTVAGEQLRAEDIRDRVNGYERGVVPGSAQYLTGFIDVQKHCLYWLLVAWEKNYTGYVIEYDTYPQQNKPYFAYADVSRTLGRVFKGVDENTAIHTGLLGLMKSLTENDWRRADGGFQKIDKLLVDRGHWTETVDAACRSMGTPIIMPAAGKGIGASARPFSEYRPQKGATIGHYHRVVTPQVGTMRFLEHDTNFWKSFVRVRLQAGIRDATAMSLFGKVGQDHRMLAEQLSSEYYVTTEAKGRGRTVDEWKKLPNRDNHFFDCLVGAAAGAVLLGCELEQAGVSTVRRKRYKLSELQKARR